MCPDSHTTGFAGHTSIMSTTIYRVAYPNPKIRPMQRVCVCSVDSTTSYRQLCSQLCDEYPDYIEDLKRAIFYKASPGPSSIDSFVTLPSTGAIG